MILPPNITRAQALERACQRLKNIIPDNMRLEARILLAAALKVTIEDIFLSFDQKMLPQQIQDFDALLERREKCEPISRILGKREFWSLSFQISDATLDPRPDSETLIEAVTRDYTTVQKPLTVLDLGTGSGCLLLTLLNELPHAKGIGVDISFDALKVAQENSKILQLSPRVLWLQSNWMDAALGPFDIIISNPPYIPMDEIEYLAPDVRLYDPYQALAGGEDGLVYYRYLSKQLRASCHAETKVYLEVGKGQDQEVDLLMQAQGFKLARWYQDLSGIFRCGKFVL